MRKVIGIFLLFLLTCSYSFGFEGELETSSTRVEVGEVFDLSLDIQFLDDEELVVDKIDGIENFEIVGTSTSQSYSGKTVMNNGELEVEKKGIKRVNLKLIAKSSGVFTLGPVTITSDSETTQTNSVVLEVQKKNSISNSSIKNANNIIVKQNKQNYHSNFNHSPTHERYITNLFIKLIKAIVIASLIFLIALVIIKLFRTRTEDLSVDGNYDDAGTKQEKKSKIKDTNTQDKLPNIDEEAFFRKAESHLRYILETKYNINVPADKTLSEIEKPKSLTPEKLELYNRIISNFEKIKYSDILVTRSDLYNQIKEFTQ